MVRVIKHWHRLQRGVVDAPSLETFKARQGRARNDLFYCKVSLPIKIPSNPNQPPCDSTKTHERHQGPADTECLFPAASTPNLPPKSIPWLGRSQAGPTLPVPVVVVAVRARPLSCFSRAGGDRTTRPR